ncbi:type 1 glutamine amidotransferase [Leucobacter sp. wl10]|uniref:type 1 glutamine amidotransferase n=1 Tax=Leucobacter sp. wl10 TaxID=2304677 RepID=UPI000E5AEDC2|nr:type 1 glutamine amidotransferase [Leucobacter sp. wl10]RGE21017.1 type 1 glutamine amidotransferase [Leucobacter sp. wl10]
MSATRVLVVEHEADTGIQRVGRALSEAGAQLDIVGPETGTELPENLAGYDALVVLGGSPGPEDDDRAPWMPRTRSLVREALDGEVPYLGICLGAQVLGVVAGGAVGDAEHPEVGLCGFELTPAAEGDPLLGGLETTAGPLRAMQWHFLEVTRLPPGSVSLARSGACANQAFRVGRNAWGVQFHLEADAEIAAGWAGPEHSRRELARAGLTAENVVARMREDEEWLDRTWSDVARRWLAVARG